MQNLYEVLQTPTQENLHFHSIDYFDKIIEKYPQDYKNIISYINDCFHYHSPFLVDEKEWGNLLMERFRANKIPEELRSALFQYESEEIVFGMASFLAHQKEATWATLVAKQNLRINMLAVIQGFSASISDKKNANELVTTLDIEINDIYEKLRQEQKRFGNYKGYDAVKSAKSKLKINVANFID